MVKTAPKPTQPTEPQEPPFLEGEGDELSKDYRVQDPNYGASNAFLPIDEGIPAVTYYMLKANLAVPIPRTMISSKQKGWDKKKNEPIIIEYANVTDLKDLLDERVGIWTAEVKDFRQIGNSMCIVVRLAIFASDGIWNSDGTGIEPLDTNSFGDPFSNAYAQGFRRACEGHGMGREMWRKSEHVENEAEPNDVGNSDYRPVNNPGQELPDRDPKAKSLGDMVTAKQLGLIRSISREARIDADEECKAKLQCNIDELSKRAASDFIDHLNLLSRQGNMPTHSGNVAPINRQSGTTPSTPSYDPAEPAPTSGPPASEKQKDYIRNLAVDKGANEELTALSLFKTEFENISKSQASQMIEHLLGKTQ